MKTPHRTAGPGGFRSGLLWGIVIALAVLIVVPLALAASGVVDVSAERSFGPLDTFLGYASGRSVAFHATDRTSPYAYDPRAIADALPHYKEMCVVCHGAPGLERSEISNGLHPAAPNLASGDTQAMTDGQLYWIIANGVASTGMPSFEQADDAQTRWKIVSFVRHLPQLTDAERAQLASTTEEVPRAHADASPTAAGTDRVSKHT